MVSLHGTTTSPQNGVPEWRGILPRAPLVPSIHPGWSFWRLSARGIEGWSERQRLGLWWSQPETCGKEKRAQKGQLSSHIRILLIPFGPYSSQNAATVPDTWGWRPSGPQEPQVVRPQQSLARGSRRKALFLYLSPPGTGSPTIVIKSCGRIPAWRGRSKGTICGGKRRDWSFRFSRANTIYLQIFYHHHPPTNAIKKELLVKDYFKLWSWCVSLTQSPSPSPTTFQPLVWLMQVKDNMEVFKSLIKRRVYKIAAVQINNSHEPRLCGEACVSLWDNTSSSVIHPGINVDAAGAVLVPPQSWAQCFQLYGG